MIRILLGHFDWYLFLVDLLPVLAVALFVHSAWKALDADKKRPNPLLAALLLFVPILNMIWIYWAIYPLGSAIKEDAKKYALSDEVGDAFSRVACHLQIACFVLLPLVVFILWGASTSSNSILNSLLLPALLYLGSLLLMVIIYLVMFFHYARLINTIVCRRNMLKTHF
jgi:magnesium-transporting ATPase (P-type)